MAIGDITTSAIASLEYESSSTSGYEIVHHSSDLYVMAHSNSTNYGNITTVRISDDGTTMAIIDTWEFYTGITVGFALIRVSPGLFMVMCRTGNGTECFTLRVDNSGNITKSKVNSIAPYGGTPYWPHVKRLENTDYYVFSYRWLGGSNLHIHVIHCDPVSGELTSTDVDTVGTFGRSSGLVILGDNMIVSVANDNTQQGHIRTLTIDRDTGILSLFLDDDATMSGSGLFWDCSIIPVYEDGDMVVFFYRGSGTDGYLQTARIDTITGNITLLNNMEIDVNHGYIGELQQLDFKGNVMLCYNGYSVSNPTTEGYVKTYTIDAQGTIALHDSWAIGDEEWAVVSEGNGKILSIGEPDSGIFILNRARTSNNYGTLTAIEVEADLSPSTTRSTKLFAPTDTIPVLTSGRNGSGYSSGHQPKYTLDNDPDTWWLSSTFGTSYLYYDLGSAVIVDAITLWLHNYNENYEDDKAWTIGYSSDDATYYDLPTKKFADYRSSYTPLIVDELPVPVSARYWRISFTNFSSAPQTVRPEISAVWFQNDYSLPWKHEQPVTNRLIYHNNQTIVRSGHRFATPAGLGKQRVMQREFVFTDDTNQWTNLLSAYHAARGRNLPVIMQCDLDSDEYSAVQFEQPLSERQIGHDLWTPTPTLREIGHKRVSHKNRSLTLTYQTVGLWRFQQDGVDDSGEDNDFTLSGITADDFIHGYADQGVSAFSSTIGDTFEITGPNATDFEMDSGNFTIEVWQLMKSAITGADRSILRHISGTTGYNVTANASYYFTVNMGDGAVALSLTNGVAGNDNMWHLHTVTIDRSANEARFYLDGEFQVTRDISSITGSIGIETPLRIYHLTEDNMVLWDELCITKRALSATEIVNRYAGRDDYGSWGM